MGKKGNMHDDRHSITMHVHRRIDTHEDHEQLQDDLNTLTAWADAWGMTCNTNKCYSMHIMTQQKRNHEVFIPYHMHRSELERVKNTQYLGASISEDLSWRTTMRWQQAEHMA